MMLEIILVISVVMNGFLLYLLYRASKRLIQFDDLFELFVHDIETNVKYFHKLATTPVLGNVPEIIDAANNMKIIRDRLAEYIFRMEELSNRKLRKSEPKPNPPVVI